MHVISRKTNSSAFRSLKILTAFIGSPMYLGSLNLTVFTSPLPFNSNTGIIRGKNITYKVSDYLILFSRNAKFFSISNPES